LIEDTRYRARWGDWNRDTGLIGAAVRRCPARCRTCSLPAAGWKPVALDVA